MLTERLGKQYVVQLGFFVYGGFPDLEYILFLDFGVFVVRFFDQGGGCGGGPPKSRGQYSSFSHPL
mgnify:CR=1 FL=1